MSNPLSFILGMLGMIGATVLAAYFFIRVLKKSQTPGALVAKWLLTAAAFVFWIYLGTQAQGYNAFFVVPAGAFSAIFIGIIWAPHIGEWLASPITKWYDGGDEEPELRPLYSIATAFRKRGAYDKAIAEIRRQLANFPEDFQGWMMLAEVQAEDLNNLDAASETIDYIAALPELAPKNFSFAMGRLADWHLKRANPDAAREALERVIDRLPATHEAQNAAQRIAHLATPEHLQDMLDPHKVTLTRHDEKLGLRDLTAPAPSDNPTERAQELVDHLSEHPLDIDARERLASLYANDFQRLDLATGELEQLITAPNQTPKNIAHWLNLLADFQIRLANDIDLARATLQRIIDLYPRSAPAATATVRMSQLRLELNKNTRQGTVKLGTYEQNIGLKRMTSGGQNEPE